MCFPGVLHSTLRMNTKKSRESSWIHTAGCLRSLQALPPYNANPDGNAAADLGASMALARHGNLPGRMHPHPNCTKNAPKYPTSKKANFIGKKAGPAGNGVGRSRAWTTTRGILLMNRHRRAARKYTKVVTSQPTYPPTRHVPTPQK